ncbi:unnamed protein product [marine sediment metagenome]|uniref:Uncharacterized protein n=1 Tax=marine sediment metagenome TaxID=412755 RepID=X0SC86_9ZZZZ
MARVGDINPATGVRYSPQEIQRINAGLDPTTGLGVGAAPTTPIATTATIATTAPTAQGVWFEGQYLGDVDEDFAGLDQPGKEAWIQEHFGVDVAGQVWGFGGPPPGDMPTRPEGGLAPTTPTFGEGAAAGIPTPEITPAPPYEIPPEMQEMMDLYGDKLTDWVTSGGYELSPEVQAQMIQVQTDTLKAREQENIRVMRNNMERRGITNSGYLQANENMITSNTSVALAGAIADVQIKSALMKMASFEKGMGAMAQFLGFLSEQSQLAYAPEFATWQAEQLKTMQVWQGKLDVYKMELNQSYQTQNMRLQAQLTSQLNQEQHQFDLALAEMEIEANQQIALYQGIGGIFGTVLGFIFGK